MKKILILGGGVAGCSVAYFLRQKGGYETTILEQSDGLGGLSRTHYYAGHPYEFGPHIWFWPHDELNDVIRELSDNKLRYIERRLLSYIERDSKAYRYPIHYDDIFEMPDKEIILDELTASRDTTGRLVSSRLPRLGDCTFEEYFVATIGETLYEKFMKHYTWKMWSIPGGRLQTSMVWADRTKYDYEGLKGYDPIKFEDHYLGKGLFQVYPEEGWNQIWNRMTEGANVKHNTIVLMTSREIIGTTRDRYAYKDYHAVINTLPLDQLWVGEELPYTGRLIIPLLIPGLKQVFPNGIESIHYSGYEPQTRVTEIDRITGYESDNTLILLEIPVNAGSEEAFPANIIPYKHFCSRTYPQQSERGLELHQSYLNKCARVGNFFNCGRQAEFKYWGMPETVASAKHLVEEHF